MRNEPLTLPAGRSNSPTPNPKAFGLSWKPMQKLLERQVKLHDEARELNFEYLQARDHLQRLEASEVDVLAEAMRSGEDAPDIAGQIAQARADLEGIEKRAAVLSRAHEKGAAELHRLVRENADRWRSEVRARAEDKAREVEDAVSYLRAAQGKLYAMSALAGWLKKPERNFGFASGPENLTTFAGRIKPSEIFDAIIQDARERAATPEEREQQRWRALGATATPSPGWRA